MKTEEGVPVVGMRGATWIYRATIENGAGGGGTVQVIIDPPATSKIELWALRITNQDTVTRAVSAAVRDEGNGVLYSLLGGSTAAANFRQWPGNSDIGDGNFVVQAPVTISGAMDLQLNVAAVAASQDGRFTVQCRIFGALPTATETGNSTPTITVATEQIA